MGTDEGNLLFYGDNLKVLREHVKDESVDLVYLDPPFQSGQTYNVLFAEKNGTSPVARQPRPAVVVTRASSTPCVLMPYPA